MENGVFGRAKKCILEVGGGAIKTYKHKEKYIMEKVLSRMKRKVCCEEGVCLKQNHVMGRGTSITELWGVAYLERKYKNVGKVYLECKEMYIKTRGLSRSQRKMW